MKKFYRRIFFSSIILWVVSFDMSNCYAQRKGGNRFPFRSFEVYGVDQQHIDKWIVKKNYKKELHEIDSTYVTKTDTSVECDSIKFLFGRDLANLSSLFVGGIISCNEFRWIDGTNWIIEKWEKPTSYIWNLQLLDFIQTKATKRMIKFRIYPRTIYYAELTNENADKCTSLEKFIKDAHLTWLYKSPQYVPNM